jgi:hypothetical protein
MKRLMAAIVGFGLLVGLAGDAGSEPWGRTGDKTLDSTLEKINTAANADPDGFIQQLSSRLKVGEQDIRQAQETYGLGAADTFMATALANATHRPVLSVAKQYTANQGKGWGVLAKDLGIKPGSRVFHQLKRNARGSLSQMDSEAKSKQKHERDMKKVHEQKVKRSADEKRHGKP